MGFSLIVQAASAAPKCRSCRTPRYLPPENMIRLTEIREIGPYVWVHPDDDRSASAHGQFTANALRLPLIALFALAPVGLVQPSVASARGGGGGGHGGGGGGGGQAAAVSTAVAEVASTVEDFTVEDFTADFTGVRL